MTVAPQLLAEAVGALQQAYAPQTLDEGVQDRQRVVTTVEFVPCDESFAKLNANRKPKKVLLLTVASSSCGEKITTLSHTRKHVQACRCRS